MKILLIGESCIDEYVYGTCDRICPEAPSICFKSNGKITRNKGMASNVLSNLKSLRPSIHIDLLTNESEIVKRRFVDTRYNTIVFREDCNDSCDRINLEDKSFIGYDAIVFSDYCKGFLEEEDIKHICREGRYAFRFMDTKKRLGSFMQFLNFIKINQDEYNRNLDNDFLGQCENLIVTCGDKGAVHMAAESEPTSIFRIDDEGNSVRQHRFINNPTMYQTEKVDVRDVCGAGDTFLAALVIQYIESKNIPDSIKYANECAAKVVKKFGVATP